MTIWKYILKITDEQTILMPDFAQILSVGVQEKPRYTPNLCLWVLVEENNQQTPRTFRIYGTGNPIERPVGRFIGAVQMGKLAWHVLEK